MRKALYDVSLEQADLRQHIQNATINIHQEEKVIRPDNKDLIHNLNNFKAVADLKIEIGV